MIGRRRSVTASMISSVASSADRPLRSPNRRWIASTITIEPFTTMPARPIDPIIANMLSALPCRKKTTITPPIASGITSITNSASSREPSISQMTTAMPTTASRAATAMRAVTFCVSTASPPLRTKSPGMFSKRGNSSVSIRAANVRAVRSLDSRKLARTVADR